MTNRIPLNQLQYQVVRDLVRDHSSVPAFILIRDIIVPVTVVGYNPAFPQCLVLRNQQGKDSQPVPYTSILVTEQTAQQLQAAVEARETYRVNALVFAMTSRHNRTADGRFADGVHSGQR